jgi:hypothetical protein
MEEVLILFVAVITISFVFMVSSTIRQIAQRRFLHRERMLAIEKGLPPPPESLTDADEERRRKTASQGAGFHGVIWTALGAGILVSSYVVYSPEDWTDLSKFLAFLRIWAFPALFVGLGLLLYARLSRDKAPKSNRPGSSPPAESEADRSKQSLL